MKKNMMLHFQEVLTRVTAWLDDMLFPEGVTCLVCGRAPHNELADGLCEACAQALELLYAKQEERNGIKEDISPGIAYVHAAFPYQDEAKTLVRRLKFHHIRSAAVPMWRAMATLPSSDEELLIPVPTTAKRLRMRGFNQADLLAQGIGRELGMEVAHVLERVGEQEAQAKLPLHLRKVNLHGCMRCIRRLDGKKVILVDDVYTTGATAMEAARALYEAGAVHVGVFAAARTLSVEEGPEFLRDPLES